MDKTLISWTVPNMVTIWLMLAIGFLVLSLVAQLGMNFLGGGTQPSAAANNAGGY